MGKPGGNNCCIPGCTNYYEKTKRCCDENNVVSYVGFPKAGVSQQQDQWRKSLIHAARRADKHFNPDTHKMCSAHFPRRDLLFHGRYWHEICNQVTSKQ